MEEYEYSISACFGIWASFDHGTVYAGSIEHAKILVEEKVREDFQKVKDALEHCENTKGFTIDFDPNCINVTKSSK